MAKAPENVNDTPDPDWRPEYPKSSPRSESRSMSSRAEPITVNRTLGIAISVIGFIIGGVGVAMVTSIIQQGNAITRQEANQKASADKSETAIANLAKQLDKTSSETAEQIKGLTAAIALGTQNRYTASDAVQDRASVLNTLNTARDAINRQMDTLTKLNIEQASTIADLRVKMATIEAKVKP